MSRLFPRRHRAQPILAVALAGAILSAPAQAHDWWPMTPPHDLERPHFAWPDHPHMPPAWRTPDPAPRWEGWPGWSHRRPSFPAWPFALVPPGMAHRFEYQFDPAPRADRPWTSPGLEPLGRLSALCDAVGADCSAFPFGAAPHLGWPRH
ncbi:hypothetical protein N0B44_22895 [Roseibacterium beibuensis]|uniref:Uncharacterized protein n=1 Tax=[Roseibacterium] beibuensis TaxID=1193142 RepID=A0ABP9LMD5_9RHOB|nr:hypothetical protein [Roseibacterium beibuensis]MCS6625765.1 hypothetical protein [Roseibacterium beibuensis]